MPTRFSKVKPPSRPRDELRKAVFKKLQDKEPAEAVEYLLGYFTSVDLELILDELREKKDENRP